ncbi:hypothetical protein JCM14469_39070 [Desulfatiferula olefinivorans]
MKTSNQFYRVSPGDICFIRYVFEALDGIAVITTLSSDKEVIVVRVAPGCEQEVAEVIDGLNETVTLEPVTMEVEF